MKSAPVRLEEVAVGSLGVSPTTAVILLGTSLSMKQIVFGKHFLLYHRSGHSPQPWIRRIMSSLHWSLQISDGLVLPRFPAIAANNLALLCVAS